MSLENTFFADQDFPDLSQQDFIFFKDLIFRLAGISMSEKKQDLVRSRIRSYIQKRGLASFNEYRKLLANTADDNLEIQKFINLLTTNKTDFFREPKHFNHLNSIVIPSWIKSQKKEVSIWCCASSTGEEPHTLSLILNNHLPPDMTYRILATDIDTQVLAKAQNGVYSSSKISEIPLDYRDQNVKLGQKNATGWFKIEDHINNKITFKQHNLTGNAYPGDERFDVIFCRNVLIYFSPETIRTLMAKLHHSLKKDGLLYIGHSESIQGCGHLFKTIKPSIFTKI